METIIQLVLILIPLAIFGLYTYYTGLKAGIKVGMQDGSKLGSKITLCFLVYKSLITTEQATKVDPSLTEVKINNTIEYYKEVFKNAKL